MFSEMTEQVTMVQFQKSLASWHTLHQWGLISGVAKTPKACYFHFYIIDAL